MRIRKYNQLDRKAVEHIHFETGCMGSSMSHVLSNNMLWKGMISYYLDREPQSAFVLEHNGKIYGYLLGCIDDKKQSMFIALLRILSCFFRSRFAKKKDRIFWKNYMNYLFDIIKGKSGERELKVPENSGHFHINLLTDARGKSYGTKMLKAFEEYAAGRGVRTIHAESIQREIYCSKNFWTKNGFKEYGRVKTTYWKKYFPETMFLVCNAKKIS